MYPLILLMCSISFLRAKPEGNFVIQASLQVFTLQWSSDKACKRLCPLCQPARRPYLVHVVTGDHFNAGTDSPVYVQFLGEHGSSNPFNLDERNWIHKADKNGNAVKMFQRNQVDLLTLLSRQLLVKNLCRVSLFTWYRTPTMSLFSITNPL